MAHLCSLNTDGVVSNNLNRLSNLRFVSAENPRSLSYFQSMMSIKEEQERHLRINKYAIHPFSKFRAWYEIYLIYLYGSLLVTKPVDAGFLTSVFHRTMPFYRYYTLFTDILCWIDIFITFQTGYDIGKRKIIELRRKSIAKHYMFGPYFLVDVITSIPKTLTYYIPPTTWRPIIFGFLTIAALMKMIRIITVLNCIRNTAEYLRIRAKGKLFLLCSGFVSGLVTHYMACLQFAVPILVRRTFVIDNMKRSWFYGGGLRDKPLTNQYINSFFKSTSYILGIRLNLYTTNLPEEYILIIFTYFIGKILIAFIWIILAVAILNSRSMDIKYAEVINQLEEYISRKQLPFSLNTRILQYFNFKFQKKYFKEDLIRNMLSDGIKHNVNMHVCKSLVENVALFNEMNVIEISRIVEYLIPEIYLPNDTIMQSGTFGDCMYFISSGTVAIYSRSGKEICHLQDGAYFGEISLVLRDQMRMVSAIAVETTHVYRLLKKNVAKFLMTNKIVMQKLIRNAEIKMKEINNVEETYKKLLFEQQFHKIS